MTRQQRTFFIAAALLIALGALLSFGGASAQAPGGYDCEIVLAADGSVSGHCDPHTPTPTATPEPTATPTATPTPQPPMWAGDVNGYSIDGDTLHVNGGGVILWQERFGADQEAFVTLAGIDRKSAGIALLLLSASPLDATRGGLAVRYNPALGTVQPWCSTGGAWYSAGVEVPAQLGVGSQFGARVLDGTAFVYRDGAQVAAWTLPARCPRAGGYAGLATDAASGNVFDDFGAGEVQ